MRITSAAALPGKYCVQTHNHLTIGRKHHPFGFARAYDLLSPHAPETGADDDLRSPRG